MVKKKLIQKAVVSILTAACVLSQFGIAWAGVTGSTPAIKEESMYIQGDWRYENESWKHYEGTGALSAGWIQKESGWYYLRPEDGTLMTGWFQDDKESTISILLMMVQRGRCAPAGTRMETERGTFLIRPMREPSGP